MDNMIRAMTAAAALNETDIEAIGSVSRFISLKKNEFWIEAGKTNRNIGFVKSGFLRMYYAARGREITDYFYFENDFTSDIPSIIANKTSLCNIAAMEDTELIVISYDDLDRLCAASHNIEHLFRLLLSGTINKLCERSASLITQTAAERYKTLLENRKDIFQRAPLSQIASYLGITQQHLSRIRKSLTQL